MTTAGEVAVPSISATSGKVARGVPAQAGSAGPKSRNVTVPVGPNPPTTVAVSWVETPSVPVAGVACVVIVGVAGGTVTSSAASGHTPIAPSLFASPVYWAIQ